MDGHFDTALPAGGHDGLQEVFQVIPQLFLGDGLVLLKQLIQLGHTLRLPAGEGHVVLLSEGHDVIRHLLGVLVDFGRLVIQRRGAVPHRVEQVRPSPVEHRHEVVADHLHPKGRQVADGLLVVLDILVPAGQADLDVVVDIDGLHHVHVEAVLVQLLLHRRDLLGLPDFPRHFVVKRPDNALHARNLLDVGQLDLVVALAVPAPGHLHWHIITS